MDNAGRYRTSEANRQLIAKIMAKAFFEIFGSTTICVLLSWFLIASEFADSFTIALLTLLCASVCAAGISLSVGNDVEEFLGKLERPN